MYDFQYMRCVTQNVYVPLKLYEKSSKNTKCGYAEIDQVDGGLSKCLLKKPK